MKNLLIIFFLLLLPCMGWGGVDLSGDGDELGCGSDSSIDDLFTSTMSVYIRFNTDVVDSTLRRMISKQSTSAGFNGWSIYQDNSGTGNQLEFSVAYTTTNGLWRAKDDYSTGIDYCFILTYDGTSTTNDPVFYLDGVSLALDSDTNPSGSADSDAAINFKIGNFDNLARPFNGKIRELALYNKILNQSERENLCDSKVRLSHQFSPVAYWRLDDGSNGTTLSTSASFYKDMVGVNHCTGVDGDGNSLNIDENIINY